MTVHACRSDLEEANVRRDEARIWFVRFLMRKVRADTYPSTTELDLIEAMIPRHMFDEYLEILIDKVDDECYPSISLLRRIKRMIECLPHRDHVTDDHEIDEEPATDEVKA
jgi:hypothetical protein